MGGDSSYNLVVDDAVGLAPSRHDKGVVVGNEDDEIGTALLELVKLLNVARQVVGLAGWRKGAWDGDEDDLLVLKLLAGVELDGHAASRHLGRLWSWGNIGEADALGEWLADQVRHCGSCV